MTYDSTETLNLNPQEMREEAWKAYNALEKILISGDRVFAEMLGGDETADELQAALDTVGRTLAKLNGQYLAHEVDDIPDALLIEIAELPQQIEIEEQQQASAQILDE